MKILFIGANGIDTSQLRLGAELRDVRAEIQRAQASSEIEVRAEFAATPIDLNRLLLEYEPDVVHFSGHGKRARKSSSKRFTSKSVILLETREGHSTPVTIDALARLFGILKTPRCVVLNACFSAAHAATLAMHTDCVIGMKRRIDDESALVFSVGFYQAIARGQAVKTAFDLGCSLISTCGLPGADVPKLLGRADPATVRLVQSGTSKNAIKPLHISDVQVIPNDETCTLDFRVWNSGNGNILINRVLLRAVEVYQTLGGATAFLKFSREYYLDIDPLEKPDDVISCNVSQVVGPQGVDRFGIRIGAKIHGGASRFWKLRPSLLTNLGRIEGPEVNVLLPPDSDGGFLEKLESRILHWQKAIPPCLVQYRNEIHNPDVALAPIWAILERVYTDPILRFQVLSDWFGPPLDTWDLDGSLPGRLMNEFPHYLLWEELRS